MFGYSDMFKKFGWEITDSLEEAELVQFTGGEDVNPALYDEEKHPSTNFNNTRDQKEILLFTRALKLGKPMAGICRGGQFLNVMCGGKLWQDVNGHLGSHLACDVDTGLIHTVTSTHHQMMKPGPDAKIIMVAYESRSRDYMRGGREITNFQQKFEDIESVYYPTQKCFCFQPHPEFAGQETLAGVYFEYIAQYLDRDQVRRAA